MSSVKIWVNLENWEFLAMLVLCYKKIIFCLLSGPSWTSPPSLCFSSCTFPFSSLFYWFMSLSLLLWFFLLSSFVLNFLVFFLPLFFIENVFLWAECLVNHTKMITQGFYCINSYAWVVRLFFFKPIAFLGIKQKLKLNQKNTSNISIKTINTVNNIILNNIILDAF